MITGHRVPFIREPRYLSTSTKSDSFFHRITGHHHHWYEVLGGAILGAVIALSSYPMKEIQIRRQFITENQKIYGNLVKPSDVECGEVAGSSKEEDTDV